VLLSGDTVMFHTGLLTFAMNGNGVPVTGSIAARLVRATVVSPSGLTSAVNCPAM